MKKIIYTSMAVAMCASFAAAQESPWASKGCVAFVNGTGDYDQNCYSSGLERMEPGKCYTYNTLRGPEVPQWINNQASESWWWSEVECVPVPPEPVLEEGTYKVVSRECIAFENGTGDYDKHCYSSGLEKMKEGKCYTFNTARGEVPQWINKIATETWWWVEMECADIVVCRDAEGNAIQCPADDDQQQGGDDQQQGGDDQQQGGDDQQQGGDDQQQGGDDQQQGGDDQQQGGDDQQQGGDDQQQGGDDQQQGGDDQQQGGDDQQQGGDDQQQGGDDEEVNCSDEANQDDPACAEYFQDKCIEYVHGAGHYAENCYKSGLTGQVAGKCYALNPERAAEYADALYINPSSWDSYWWQEVSCDQKIYVAPVDWTKFEEVVKECIEYKHGAGDYDKHCYNAGLNGMKANTCYVINPDRLGPVDLAGFDKYINGNAFDSHWWVETSCTEIVPKAEPKAEPKVAHKALEVVASAADVKTLRVFDMNGKLLHSETFTGSVNDVDFAKFAGKGVRLVRVTSGNKLVAMKTVAAR